MKNNENKNSGKLSLKKETIASLNREEQDSIIGGGQLTDLCPTTGTATDPGSDNLCTEGSCVTTSYAPSICIDCP